MQPTTRQITITTHAGRKVEVMEVTYWIDASDKTGASHLPGRKELRTAAGQGIAFDGSTFTLPNGERFDPPQA